MNREEKMQMAQLIGEISSLGYMVNTFTKYCVFVDFSGHVEYFKVSIRVAKDRYNEIITDDQVYVSENWYEEKTTIQSLINLKSNLRKILLQKKISYDGLKYTVREEHDYHLI